jgi:hypothetical protein
MYMYKKRTTTTAEHVLTSIASNSQYYTPIKVVQFVSTKCSLAVIKTHMVITIHSLSLMLYNVLLLCNLHSRQASRAKHVHLSYCCIRRDGRSFKVQRRQCTAIVTNNGACKTDLVLKQSCSNLLVTLKLFHTSDGYMRKPLYASRCRS